MITFAPGFVELNKCEIRFQWQTVRLIYIIGRFPTKIEQISRFFSILVENRPIIDESNRNLFLEMNFALIQLYEPWRKVTHQEKSDYHVVTTPKVSDLEKIIRKKVDGKILGNVGLKNLGNLKNLGKWVFEKSWEKNEQVKNLGKVKKKLAQLFLSCVGGVMLWVQ